MGGYNESNASSVNEFTGVLYENDAETNDGGLNKNVAELRHAEEWKIELVWKKIITIGLFHVGAAYGLYLMITSARIYTIIFGSIKYMFKKSMIPTTNLN